MANEFFQQQEHQSPLKSPLLFQKPQQSSSPLLLQQHSPIILQQQQEDWSREFIRHSATPPCYDEFEHIYQQHTTSKSPLFSWTAEYFYQYQHRVASSSDVSEADQKLAFERAFEEVASVSAVKDHQYNKDWNREFGDRETWEAAEPYSQALQQQKYTMIHGNEHQVMPTSPTTLLKKKLNTVSQQQQVPKIVEREEDQIQPHNKKNSKAWDPLLPDGKPYGYRALHPNYEIYHCTSNNPYLTDHQDAIDTIPHPSLSDAILALEAKSQLFPKDAKTWEQLGLYQQENERDDAAITALEKAVSLDPSKCLNAWLALAASYTNEHCRMDAYNCLEQWISHNTKYKHLLNHPLGQHYNDQARRHTYMTQLYLKAARTSPYKEDMDPNVQIGLGILFNMSEDYEKAIDCFKAALTSRPTDYQLWNKVGATMANAGDRLSAIEMYFEALQLNPLFVRARYNLAVSCMNLGQYLEAAEHLLTALALQRETAAKAGSLEGGGQGGGEEVLNVASDGMWNSLRLLMYM